MKKITLLLTIKTVPQQDVDEQLKYRLDIRVRLIYVYYSICSLHSAVFILVCIPHAIFFVYINNSSYFEMREIHIQLEGGRHFFLGPIGGS